MEIGLMSILFAVLGALGITMLTLALYASMKKSRYDAEANRALLESIRSSFESKIYGLNDRLILNEERWRDVNHLLIKRVSSADQARPNLRRVHYSEFLRSNGVLESDLIVDERMIFVLTPFHDKYYEEYKVIKETCDNSGFKCTRGDEERINGDIFPEMLKRIVRAQLVIANINGRNPNVLYELGVAQALDKKVILVAREPKSLPADIKSKRFLIYETYEQLQALLRTELLDL
jgi:hypothetical protein